MNHSADEGPRDTADSDLDQASADADQGSADSDQTSADRDQTASDRDQLAANADELAAERDQRAADSDFPAEPTKAIADAHRASERARARSGLERHATGVGRAQTASDRDQQALVREAGARARDLASAARDRAAEVRDEAAFETVRKMELSGQGRWKEAASAAAHLRSSAAGGRLRAANDREQAASDRAESALDRAKLHAALDAAHLDDLTGAFRRAMGEIVLRNEIQRAQREGVPLTLATFDADDLKSINDARGHPAGDAMLRDIATTVRGKLRPYDPLVRTGGDEFVCTLAGSDLERSRKRISDVTTALARVQPGASISVGLADMRPDDTLESLFARADAALYEEKRSGR